MEILVNRVAEKTGYTKKLVKEITNALFQNLIELIKEKKVVRIRGFGVFKYEPSGKLRRYYNPRKKVVESKVSTAKVRFKMSKNGAWE